MATSYRTSTSIEGRHDVIYDYCCTTCEEENLNAEALYFCKDCSQLFCEPCKKYHGKFFNEHRVLGRQDAAKWGGVKPMTGSVMGDEYQGKELEMLCEDHDQGIQKSSRLKSFLSEAPKTQSGLKDLNDKQETNIKLLQKVIDKIASVLEDMRNQFKNIVDGLEEKSTQEMEKLLTMLNEKGTLDKDVCLDFHDKMQKFLLDIQNLGEQCDELAFQSYKKCSEQMASAKELLLEFTPDTKIKQHLSSLETLGTFDVTPCGLADTLKNDTISKPLTSPDHVYSVINKKSYNVKTSGDTRKCNIAGMCQLPNEQTAIVDINNSKVKLLSNSTYSVVDELKLPPRPQDICHTTGTELAVTVCNGRDLHGIQFINAENGKLSPTRSVQFDHWCVVVAYRESQLYVCSYTALYVYNMSGKKIKKLYEDISGTELPVYRFFLSDDGSRIFVINWDKDLLLLLDSSGNQLSMFSDSELEGPTGVCVAENGSVFVCGEDSYTVLQVDREGRRKITTLATQADGVYRPQSLCYDRKTQILLVGQEADNLIALQLK